MMTSKDPGVLDWSKQEVVGCFCFKQWGGVNKKKNGRVLKGRTWEEMPKL